MITCRRQAVALGVVLVLVGGIPALTFGFGFNGVGSAPCDNATQNLVGSFSSNKSQYLSNGTCTTPGSLGMPRTFPFTVKGAYANGIAEEVIEVAPPLISQPSHPYGKWHTTYSCPSDPWLTVDGPPFNPESLRVKCRIVSRADNSPADAYPRKYQNGKPLPTITDLFNVWRANKPMTSSVLMPAERQALAAKRDADLAEEKRRAVQRLKGDMPVKSPYRNALSPSVLAPAAGQKFLNQSPVPIKLATPKGWVENQVTLDGTPVNTGRIYMVRIERKDPGGNWVAHTTIPVGAVQAESPGGYLGFGAGTPPGGITSPGLWRMSAQISSPLATGWSDWIEFAVMAPPSTNSLLKQPKAFGK